MTAILIALDVVSLVGLAIYGLLGYLTLWLFVRHRHDVFPVPPLERDDLPAVTVQLPLYNEREVVGRLISAAADLDYPCDRLEIQVLDDSTDETTKLAQKFIAEFRAQGKNITLLHRNNREGYKAGALQAALPLAAGDFIAIFVADFVPSRDFLLQTIPYLKADCELGAVQTRWGHLNMTDSPLTQAQAIALDKHFAVEQFVRHRADLFPKFNGSAGVWRRGCITEVGGWQHDTVCEDLCLSTRAALAGWRFHFASQTVEPAELPISILSYKTQQARWAMGATQCLLKYAGQISRASQKSIVARMYALLSMAAYATQALFLTLLLVQLPLHLTGYRLPSWFLLFGLVGLGQPILFVLSQRALYKDWLKQLRYLPALLLIAMGTAPSNTLAVTQALFGREFSFARTPKGPRQSYRLTSYGMLLVEIGLMIYSATTLVLVVSAGNTGPIFLLITSLLAFGYISLLGIIEHLEGWRNNG